MERTEAKKYEKPRIERVELRLTEAVLGVCKTANGGAVNDLGGQVDCVLGQCSEDLGS